MTDPRIKGLYLLSDERYIDRSLFLTTVERCLKAGVSAFQFRTKSHSPEERKRYAMWLKEICGRYHAPLIINDYATLAADIGADGVHLGDEDMDISMARRILGDKAIIGVSCSGDLELARRSQAAGANYVAFGACFKSSTKPKAAVISLSVLIEAKQSLTIPVVAVGGITPKNADAILRTGVDAIAVISGVFGQHDPAKAVKSYLEVFHHFAGAATAA